MSRFQTLAWGDQALVLLDQTRLPGELVYLECRQVEEVARAIEGLVVRGAPAIGVAAAYGMAVAAGEALDQEPGAFRRHLQQARARLARTRPTAVNLFWALARMEEVLVAGNGLDNRQLYERLLARAEALRAEDEAICRSLGRQGAGLLENGFKVLTHCNAGSLATAGYGTALGVIYAAQEEGKQLRVYADETRPLLQGSRLTAWELRQRGVEVTVICDNMAATVMRSAPIDCVIVGADRIAANGDVANKIGTYGVAVLARAHQIPFYVAAPVSTLDLSLASGDQIPIEERRPEEVSRGFGRATAPEDVGIYNPAFDVTPAELVTAIVSERGVARPPFGPALRQWGEGAG
ncbi:MAG: S-methyl-5-thioribose-1-phosphate isomerase [Candidatus Handelsmanbacteria bacterium]|nr:S-methyl-5-thioribose-1-phosphate isomerase [Candidatus Handelsmanbacteria bacterium]